PRRLTHVRRTARTTWTVLGSTVSGLLVCLTWRTRQQRNIKLWLLPPSSATLPISTRLRWLKRTRCCRSRPSRLCPRTTPTRTYTSESSSTHSPVTRNVVTRRNRHVELVKYSVVSDLH